MYTSTPNSFILFENIHTVFKMYSTTVHDRLSAAFDTRPPSNVGIIAQVLLQLSIRCFDLFVIQILLSGCMNTFALKSE